MKGLLIIINIIVFIVTVAMFVITKDSYSVILASLYFLFEIAILQVKNSKESL